MSQKTYTFLEPRAMGAIFVDVNDYNSRFTVTGERRKAKNNGVSSDIIRATFLRQSQVHVEGAECTTGCTPSGLFARNVRVELTGPLGTDADLITDLEDIVAFLKSNNRWKQGLAQPQGDDITLGTV